jgi:hypothetical protein
MVHIYPYVGFPRIANAITTIKAAEIDAQEEK